ncbi:TPA: sugar phosphate isomerase/epimerase [Candidatus Poribacteria bacterium]|nr:sugar phosphate isomerase/epimerase [Candidatus Poribacteria bacterium]
MRFGVCTSLDNVNILAEAGYDYIELGVGASLMPLASEEDFKKVKDKIAASALKPEAYAGFIPGELRVVGDNVNLQRLSNFVETACRRASTVGGKVIVYGSSGSRNVEEGYSPAKALDQIAAFLGVAADHAEKYGVTIAIEPLCKKECNIINTVAEGLEMAKRVNRKGVRVLADLYHVWQEREPLANIVDAGDWLAHVHIAEPVKRKYPGNDDFDFSDLFSALKQAGYDGRVSCECGFDDFERDVKVALDTLHQYV